MCDVNLVPYDPKFSTIANYSSVSIVGHTWEDTVNYSSSLNYGYLKMVHAVLPEFPNWQV